jgi:outer membrane protein insertion porin family
MTISSRFLLVDKDAIALGGGVEYLQPVTPALDIAVGLSYQEVSVRDGVFGSDVEIVDELGNALTVSDDGRDDLLTVNLFGLYSTLDNRGFPTRGTRLRFGLDQAIPIGEANIAYNRLMANWSQYIPLDLFGFREGPRTLIVNVQTGTFLFDDVPPYEAFATGGSSSVRGYRTGQLGTSSSFLQASLEYRYPVAFFEKLDIDLTGSLFFDYGSDLGTADEVIGNPGDARDKPGEGFGYGLGFLARTRFGLFRLESAWNDSGDNLIHFTVGDRF